MATPHTLVASGRLTLALLGQLARCFNVKFNKHSACMHYFVTWQLAFAVAFCAWTLSTNLKHLKLSLLRWTVARKCRAPFPRNSRHNNFPETRNNFPPELTTQQFLRKPQHDNFPETHVLGRLLCCGCWGNCCTYGPPYCLTHRVVVKCHQVNIKQFPQIARHVRLSTVPNIGVH